MPNKNIIKYGLIALGLSLLIFLVFIFRGKKDDQTQAKPTPTPKLVEIDPMFPLSLGLTATN